jgi:hypothetical protein
MRNLPAQLCNLGSLCLLPLPLLFFIIHALSLQIHQSLLHQSLMSEQPL